MGVFASGGYAGGYVGKPDALFFLISVETQLASLLLT
jgi:hypothetical protein